MRTVVAVAALLILTPLNLAAQAAAAGPRPGAWAGDFAFSAGTATAGAALLRFRSDRSSWLLGLNATHSTEEIEDDGEETGETTVAIATRLGLRSLRGSGPTRPTIGGGIVGGYSKTSSDRRAWDAGVYLEFGVTRFFGESFSLGALADLAVRRFDLRIDEPFSARGTETRIQFDAVRINATVYF
jgi:hypothetical protein